MKPRLFPVTQFAISRRHWFRSLCSDQTKDNVRPISMIEFCREYHGRSRLGRLGARKGGNHDVAGLQRPSRSCSSNRRTDEAVTSARSSSDHESDHSIARSRPRSASCCAQSRTFLASSGESARTTLMSDSSLALRTIPHHFTPLRWQSAIVEHSAHSARAKVHWVHRFGGRRADVRHGDYAAMWRKMLPRNEVRSDAPNAISQRYAQE
jgi:hypothetical protein